MMVRIYFWLSVVAWKLRLYKLHGWAHCRWLGAHCRGFDQAQRRRSYPCEH